MAVLLIAFYFRQNPSVRTAGLRFDALAQQLCSRALASPRRKGPPVAFPGGLTPGVCYCRQPNHRTVPAPLYWFAIGVGIVGASAGSAAIGPASVWRARLKYQRDCARSHSRRAQPARARRRSFPSCLAVPEIVPDQRQSPAGGRQCLAALRCAVLCRIVSCSRLSASLISSATGRTMPGQVRNSRWRCDAFPS